MSQGRFRSFFTGALIGAGLGIFLAPKEGSETRKDLKKSFSELVDTIKEINIEETKAEFVNKAKEIKDTLSNIDQETAKEIAEEKAALVEEKCEELIEAAKENSIPIVEKAANGVKKNASELLNGFINEMEVPQEEKKKTKQTSKATNKKKSSNKSKKPSNKNNGKKRK